MQCATSPFNEEGRKENENSEETKKTKPNRARLLRRYTSHCLLLNENRNDVDAKPSKQDSTMSSSTSGLLFTRPLSSSTKKQPKPEALTRPKTSRPNLVRVSSKTEITADGKNSKQGIAKASSPTRTSVPTLSRQSSYFSLKSIRRSLSVEEASKRLRRKGSRDEKECKLRRKSFVGIVTSIDEEEQEEKRQLAATRFRRAVFLIRIFSSLCLSIRKYADQDKSRQYDLYYMRDMLPENENNTTLIQAMPITFNKHLFSRDNTLHFPLWARLTCAKKPEERTEAEMKKLATLLRGMKSFGKFSREAQRNLCQTMSYACYERRRLIVRQGHPGFCFYFIVSGSVSVTITRKDYKTGVYVTNTVDVLEKNEAFGEIALISEEAIRTATIICRERVEVLVVNRETILQYCPDVFQREYDEKVQVMKGHSLFYGWGEDLLRSLTHRSHIREYSYGKLVDIDSTASESIYFVIKGKIDMLRRVDLKAVLKSGVTTSSFHNRSLPRPATAVPGKNGNNTCYVNVGSLQPNDSWDLKTLGMDAPSGQGNILVSAGVRVLKVPKRRVIELIPKGHMEVFQENFSPRHRCLTEEEVYRDYLAAETWLDYRKKVLRNVMDIKAGRFIANVSATAKGSTGWTAWPGTQQKT
ncbi:unnamed protein product [Porites lobata]|uniref:Cyclic nucleotide-binding domain-containing protein n=1 Tax=Porites lobata TaxID=104759 RepID=A0ABN8Q3V9_9CNID|nr:unnamed protein product [Porites lobata]